MTQRATDGKQRLIEEKLLTIKELAAHLAISTRTIRRYISEGYIPLIRIGGVVRFEASSVQEWLSRHQIKEV